MYRFLCQFILLLTIPFLTFPCDPVTVFTRVNHESNLEEKVKTADQIFEILLQNEEFTNFRNTFSCESIACFLEFLENEDLESIYSEKELKKISEFLIFLAKQGILSEEERLLLDKESEEILSEFSDEISSAGSLSVDDCLIVKSPLDSSDIVLCKSFFKKCCKKIKKFVKKNKKEILIGVAVVGAVLTAGVTAIYLINSKEKKREEIKKANENSSNSVTIPIPSLDPNSEKKDGENSSSSSNFDTQFPNSNGTVASDIPLLFTIEPKGNKNDLLIPSDFSEYYKNNILSRIIEDRIWNTKEDYEDALNEFNSVAKDFPQPEFFDNAKEFSSVLSHEILDSVGELVSCVPKLVDECKEISQKFFPNGNSDADLFKSSSENFNKLVDSCHNVIDKAFSTDLATRYTAENKENINNLQDFDVGIIPPPGALGFVAEIDGSGRMLATQTNSTCGWKLGDPINNRTITGKEPKWSTVRARFWKNKAYYEPEFFNSPENLERAKKGLAPIEFNEETGKLESMELHHDPAQRDGGKYDFTPVTPEEHAERDQYRKPGK